MSVPAISLPHRAPLRERPRVLLVEDDAGVRRSLQLLLEGQGYGVRAFASAAALLADATREADACLVTDYRLGEQDGIALLSALHRAGWSGPAILMTAYRSPELADAARAAGFVQIFDKPLKSHLLIDALGRYAPRC